VNTHFEIFLLCCIHHCISFASSIAHMNLFGDSLTHDRLQECMYSLFDPEIESITSQVLKIKLWNKKQRKLIGNMSKKFLLDKLELNMKVRCIIAWSGMIAFIMQMLPLSFFLFIFRSL
jgi:hypothetical protein